MVRTRRWFTMGLVGSLVLAAESAVSLFPGSPAKAALAPETSTPFSGKAVTRGTVTHDIRDGKHLLTLSPDFEQPTTPDPHMAGRGRPGQRLPARPADAARGQGQHVHYAALLHLRRGQGPDVVRLGGDRPRRGILREADRAEVGVLLVSGRSAAHAASGRPVPWHQHSQSCQRRRSDAWQGLCLPLGSGPASERGLSREIGTLGSSPVPSCRLPALRA